MSYNQNVKVGTHYHVECVGHYHTDGLQCATPLACLAPHDRLIKWSDEFDNIVVTLGLNELLTRLVGTIPGSVSWYVGLKNAGAPVAADTMASHGSWTENVTYGDAGRRPFVAGTVAAGSVNNTAVKAVFAMNGTTTIYGAFLASDGTKSGTTGVLYGVGDFLTSRLVEDGDTLNVTVTLTATAL